MFHSIHHVEDIWEGAQHEGAELQVSHRLTYQTRERCFPEQKICAFLVPADLH